MECKITHHWDGGAEDIPHLMIVHYSTTTGGIGFHINYGMPVALSYHVHPRQVEQFALALEAAAREARAIAEANKRAQEERADYREAEGRG